MASHAGVPNPYSGKGEVAIGCRAFPLPPYAQVSSKACQNSPMLLSAFDPPTPSLTIRKAEIWLYVLELKEGRYYVGQSSKPDMRLKEHGDGKGSAWTQLYPVLRELIRQPTGTNDWKIAEAYENQWTLELMQLHGWENVRGGFWCMKCPIQTRAGLIAHGHAKLVGASDHVERAPEPVSSQPLDSVMIVYKKRRTLVRDQVTA